MAGTLKAVSLGRINGGGAASGKGAVVVVVVVVLLLLLLLLLLAKPRHCAHLAMTKPEPCSTPSRKPALTDL